MSAATLPRPTPTVAAGSPQPAATRRAVAPWLAGAALLSLAVTTFPFRDPDVWWHLAVGRVITSSGLPSSEPFSFAGAPNPWIGQQWLYEDGLAHLVSAGGPGLAMAVMGLTGALAFLVAARCTRRDDSIPGPALAASMLACALVAASVLGVRGQVVSVALSAVTLLIVTRWRDGSTRVVWALPPLFALWANLHAGFVVGLALCALAAVTVDIHRRLRGAAAEPGARVRPLLLAVAGATAATLLNPAGPRLWGYVAATFTNPTLTNGITEWMSPDFHTFWLRALELLVIGLVVAWAFTGRVDPLDAVLTLSAVAATLQAQRNLALLAVVLTPQLARHGTLVARRLRPAGAPGRRRPAPAPVVWAGAAIIGIATVFAVVVPATSSTATARWERQNEPAAAATWVGIHRAGAHLYSTYEWGGYLAYRLGAQHMVWIYGESAVFGDQRLQDYLVVHDLADGWQRMLATNGMHDAVLPPASREAVAMLEAGWVPLCQDTSGGAVVLELGGTPSRDAAPADVRSAPAC